MTEQQNREYHQPVFSPPSTQADVAELADAADLGSVALTGVEVRVLSSALSSGWQTVRARGLAGRRLLCTEEIVGSNPTGSTLQNVCGSGII